MFAAALASAFVISMSAVPVSAMADTTEQYVTVEDGVTVVYITTYVDQDQSLGEQVTTWFDANGTKFVNTTKARPSQAVSEFSSSATWSDENGNTYVLDNASNTVTVYDSNGSVIAVRPAN